MCQTTLDTEDAKYGKHGLCRRLKQGPRSEEALENEWELDERQKETSLNKKSISKENCKSSGRAETDSLNSGGGVVGMGHDVGPGGSPWSLWRLLGRGVMGSDMPFGMCSDNRVENELEERSLDARRVERPIPALMKAVGGRKDSLENEKEAVTELMLECRWGLKKKESRGTPAFRIWTLGGLKQRRNTGEAASFGGNRWLIKF